MHNFLRYDGRTVKVTWLLLDQALAMHETVMLGSSRLGLCHTQRYTYIYIGALWVALVSGLLLDVYRSLCNRNVCGWMVGTWNYTLCLVLMVTTGKKHYRVCQYFCRCDCAKQTVGHVVINLSCFLCCVRVFARGDFGGFIWHSSSKSYGDNDLSQVTVAGGHVVCVHTWLHRGADSLGWTHRQYTRMFALKMFRWLSWFAAHSTIRSAVRPIADCLGSTWRLWVKSMKWLWFTGGALKSLHDALAV